MPARAAPFLALAALAPAGARAQRPAAAPLRAVPVDPDTAWLAASRRAPGCYAVEPGAWAHDALLARLLPPALVPRRFRLVAAPLPPVEYAPGRRHVFSRVTGAPPDTAAPPIGAPFSAWEVRGAAPAYLWIGQPRRDGGGAYLMVAPVSGPAGRPGEVLEGTVAGVADERAGRMETVIRPLRARRVPCEAGRARAGTGAGAT